LVPSSVIPNLAGRIDFLLQLRVRSTYELSVARHAVREALSSQGLSATEVATLEHVVAELGNAAFDAKLDSSLTIMIETFARLHSVRLRGRVTDVLRDDDPFHLRERVLQHLTLAFGERRNGDGTVDLWAEVCRS
jgi:hypothetical protein